MFLSLKHNNNSLNKILLLTKIIILNTHVFFKLSFAEKYKMKYLLPFFRNHFCAPQNLTRKYVKFLIT